MSSTEKPTCFVISPIGPKDSDIRKRSDKVLKHIFKKALSDKYDVIRGDEIDEPGMITSQVLRAVQEAPLVVADLTGHNPNCCMNLQSAMLSRNQSFTPSSQSCRTYLLTSLAFELSSSI